MTYILLPLTGTSQWYYLLTNLDALNICDRPMIAKNIITHFYVSRNPLHMLTYNRKCRFSIV